eukprot:2513694-Karenia_brevis.AAC.1
MVLQLFGGKFRQWRCGSVSGGKREFIPPMPDDKDMPKDITLYEESDWRMDGMNLLDFLRRTNKDGKIINWL